MLGMARSGSSCALKVNVKVREAFLTNQLALRCEDRKWVRNKKKMEDRKVRQRRLKCKKTIKNV